MEIGVLVKTVPDVERLRFDPSSRTVVRDGVELLTNAFDQRALRVALELARPGDEVHVLSLGPPNAEPRLQEALALGATRATLVTDPACAGSDLLATARALVAGWRNAVPPLVLAGARSLDSDTGLVGPEVAALLGRPVVTEARALRRDDGEIEATVETAGGWATLRVPLPAVVTVGEKIAKPLRLDEAQRARAPSLFVQRLGRADLGLPAGQLGAAGSPTWVSGLSESSPARGGRRFADGAVSERVAGAMAALAPLLRRPRDAPRLAPWSSPADPSREIAVLVTDEHGRLDRGMLGWITEVRRAVPSFWPSAVWVGEAPASTAEELLAAAGAVSGYRACPSGTEVNPSAVAEVLGSLRDRRPELAAVACAATPFGRELAGLWAAPRALGVVGDAVAVAEEDGGALTWKKPSFGGQIVASIRSRSRPTVATVLPFAHPEAVGRSEPLAWTDLPDPSAASPVRRLAAGSEPLPGRSPAGASVVVAVGMGIGGPDGLRAIVPYAESWGAAVVGTRRVVDAGWLPARLQVGVSGRSLAPALAVLLGVRGSAHHMAGWRRAGAVLAVNSDPSAPVLAEADVGVVGSLAEVLPHLGPALARALAEDLGR